MNREETKKAIAVMQAYVDGKEIQVSIIPGYDFAACVPDWDWKRNLYRVSHEPETVPFETIEEIADAMNKHGCVLKCSEGIATIITVCKSHLSSSVNIQFSSKELGVFTPEFVLNEYTFLDGTPFGKTIQEET